MHRLDEEAGVRGQAVSRGEETAAEKHHQIGAVGADQAIEPSVLESRLEALADDWFA